MLKKISYFLRTQDYIPLDSSASSQAVFFRRESSFVNVIHLVNITDDQQIQVEDYKRIVEKTEWRFLDRGVEEVHSFSIVISDNLASAEPYADGNVFCWMICNGQLVCPAESIEDFYGIKTKLDDFLRNPQASVEYEDTAIKYDYSGKQSYKSIKDRPLSNHFFFLVNVLIFTLCTFTGDLLYTKGVMSLDLVVIQGQWYRLLSATFLHAGIDHLVSNMLILFFLGDIVERRLGHVKYFILYLLSGLGASLLSLWYSSYIGDYDTQSLGASGAIFGMVGALLWLLIRNKGRLETMSIPKILFLVSYSAYYGLISTNVDNMAHLGGFVSGFLICVLIYRKKSVKSER